MRRYPFVLILLGLVLAATALIDIKYPLNNRPWQRARVQQRLGVPGSANARVMEAYGKLPLSFEANQGQTDSHVRFLSRGGGYSLFLTATEAVVELKKKSGVRSQKSEAGTPDTRHPAPDTLFPSATSADDSVLHMKLVGANASARIEGAEELPGKSNYFIGNDPSKWRTNVPTYAKVKYEDVYPGIDLVYYGNQRQLEYDFVVAPGADPAAIRLAFPVSNPSRDSNGAGAPPLAYARGSDHQNAPSNGAVLPRIDANGDLVFDADASELRLHRPDIYQEISGSRHSVDGNFVLRPETRHLTPDTRMEVGFEVARYDASKPLIIDPALTYSTYLGGSSYDYGQAIAVDSSGNAYVTGHTQSTNFPTLNAYQNTFNGSYEDVSVTKLNAAGSALVYSTYIGGSSGNGDEGLAIAVDSSGYAYVTGYTGATDFPITPLSAYQTTNGSGGFNDAFVTRLSPAGSALVYSTYLGGGTYDYGYGIAADNNGNAYVIGSTHSSDFPTTNGAFQQALGSTYAAFVAKINTNKSGIPSLAFSTYLGGTTNDTYGYGIALDSVGNVYVTGYTYATNFPTTLGAFQTTTGGGVDAFVTKLAGNGSLLLYSSYLGGSGTDEGLAIAVDSSNNAYVTGYTHSTTNFPTTLNAYQTTYGGSNYDAFVTKVNASGSALAYSTYLGGNNIDQGYGIAVDASGNAYVTGYTNSSNFPTANAFQPANGGSADVFVTNLNAAGSGAIYSTYLGGTLSDYSNGIAVDASGNAYVVGYTGSANFSTTANAYKGSNSGSYDAFVTKFSAFPPSQSDAAVDFWPNNNPSGLWKYGWATTLSPTPAQLTLYSSHANSLGIDWWTDPNHVSLNTPDVAHNGSASPTNTGSQIWQPGQLGFHPGQGGEYSFVRWTAPVAGSYVVTATFTGIDYAGGTTTDVHVLHNGVSLFSGNVSGYGNTTSFPAATMTMPAGDTIDFVVGYGGDGNYLNDMTALAATVNQASKKRRGQVTSD